MLIVQRKETWVVDGKSYNHDEMAYQFVLAENSENYIGNNHCIGLYYASGINVIANLGDFK
jgi:hypothetical protein